MQRRQFLETAALAGLFSTTGFNAFATASELKIDTGRFFSTKIGKAPKKLSVLFLGGTNFLGPPTVKYLLERGHDVTLFNRGQTNPYLFNKTEKLRGNRYPGKENGLKALEGDRQWDVVIDTWRDNPMAVKETVDLLENRIGRYIYVSSIAVYGNKNYETVSPITEETPLPDAEIPANIDQDIGYRRSKIHADNTVRDALRDRGAVVRPHGIYGYYMGNDTDGQTYWPIRMDKGGDILCPGDGLDHIQYIDVLDLAKFLSVIAENELSGAYNVSTQLTFREYLQKLQSLSDKPSKLHWVPQQKLTDAGIRPYSNVPLWVPRNLGPGFHNISDEKAVAAGLVYRPFEETFRTTKAGFYARLGTNHVFDKDIVSEEQAQKLLKELGYIET